MRPSFVTFGPSIEMVPVTAFNKRHVTYKEYEFLWHKFVGPHVSYNSRLQVEPWKLMCNIYLEGLLIGYGLGQDGKSSKPVVPDDGLLGLA